MTEAEARAKWCPFARVHSNGIVANRDNASDGTVTAIDDAARCLGAGCMAWRWYIVEAATDDRAQPVETWPDLTPYHEPGKKLMRHGLCGLAGKP